VAFTTPTVADFKARFDRDFSYATDQTDKSKVRDVDVTRGINSAGINFNPAIWPDQATFAEAFLLLAAHFLCVNILNSSQGLGSQSTWLMNQKHVSSMSGSYAIPEQVKEDMFLSRLATTGYGSEYLFLLAPLLIGNFQSVAGFSHPI
jgi:hypothetical protein